MSRDMDFQQCGMCDQQRLRPAWAYAQSDQSLCFSLAYSMNVQLLTEHHLEFLSLKGGCTGSSESTLVKIPHCWKSHVTAQCLVTLLVTMIVLTAGSDVPIIRQCNLDVFTGKTEHLFINNMGYREYLISSLPGKASRMPVDIARLAERFNMRSRSRAW